MLQAVLVGCGAMSNGWLKALAETPALADEVKIVGFVDLDETLARARADAHGHTDAAAGSDLDAMLADLKPDLLFDIVVPAARRTVVEKAFAHGCHVLSEKPMAANMQDAEALLEAASAAGRVWGIVQNRRHLVGIRRARKLIRDGVLGDITAVHADFFIGAHFGGFRDEMEHVLLLDMAIHTFDAARYLLPSEPVAVYCQETNPRGSWYAHGASANALFDCEDGSVFTYRGSWCAEGANTAWESTWRVIGTKGTLIWDGNDGFDGGLVAGDEGFLRPVGSLSVAMPPPLPAEGHAGVLLDFVTSLREGRKPLTVCSDNIKSLCMVFAAIESAETGRRIPFSPHRKAPTA